jgi:hypothetical protein
MLQFIKVLRGSKSSMEINTNERIESDETLSETNKMSITEGDDSATPLEPNHIFQCTNEGK